MKNKGKCIMDIDSNITVTFDKLSEWGLIYEINKNVLHQYGLALSRDLENNISFGAIIDQQDFKWEYAEENINKNEVKLNYFKENRIELLKDYIKNYIDQNEFEKLLAIKEVIDNIDQN